MNIRMDLPGNTSVFPVIVSQIIKFQNLKTFTTMKLSEIKEICQRTSNEGLKENAYWVFDHFERLLDYAWREWSDEITRPFWGGDTKPEKETESFREDYYKNMDWEVDFAAFLDQELDYATIAERLHTDNTENFKKGLDYILNDLNFSDYSTTEHILEKCGEDLTVNSMSGNDSVFLFYSDSDDLSSAFNLTTGEPLNEEQLQAFIKDMSCDESDTQIKGIEEALSEIEDAGGYQYYRVYFNKETRKVWTNLYESQNSWDEYRNKDIVEILSGHTESSIFGLTHITEEDIEEAVNSICR